MESSPKIRAVEAFPTQSEGEELICLRDPEGFAEGPIFLNQYLAFLVSRMNGRNSLRDIQADFMRATGEILPMEQLEELVQQLDGQRFLDSEAFRAFHGALVRQFLDSPVRAAQHAGSAYEGEEGLLKNQIGGFFECSDGPGQGTDTAAGTPVRGLISPHIDFHRGGPAYAHAYRTLAVRPGPDRFILFGTCHNAMQRRFALTLKHFDTPLGLVETDGDFVRKLAARLPKDYFSDEFAHRAEHSLEFQTVFLRYMHRTPERFKVVPILVGSFHDIYEKGRSAAGDEELGAFVDAVRNTIAELPARYAVIAAADLAHVGRRFGDRAGPTPDSLTIVEREDRRFLEHVAAGDAEGMFGFIAAEADRRHVCGYPPIYLTLRCIDNPRGKLLQYRQWADLESGAAVTFAAMALY
jgi:hypothetical protein